MQNFWWFSRAMMAARLSPADISNPKNAEIMLFQAYSDTPPLLNKIASENDISFNLLVLQCCKYALDNLDESEG